MNNNFDPPVYRGIDWGETPFRGVLGRQDYGRSTSSSPPYVTILLIALNVVVFLAQQRSTDEARKSAAFVPSTFLQEPKSEWKSIFTSMFTHSGALHLYFNMLALWMFGPNLEKQYGHLKFAGLYIFSGIVAVLGYSLFNKSSKIGLVGASGAISGLLAATWLATNQRSAATSFILFQFLYMLMQPSDTGGIGYLAHLFGFAAGALYYYAFKGT